MVSRVVPFRFGFAFDTNTPELGTGSGSGGGGSNGAANFPFLLGEGLPVRPAPPPRPLTTSSNAADTASANLRGCLERDFRSRSGEDARVPGVEPDPAPLPSPPK